METNVNCECSADWVTAILTATILNNRSIGFYFILPVIVSLFNTTKTTTIP